MDGKEEEEEKLAWKVLEVVHLCSPNTRVGAKAEDAEEGGGDEGGRQRALANQDHRDSRTNTGTNLGQNRSVWRKSML